MSSCRWFLRKAEGVMSTPALCTPASQAASRSLQEPDLLHHLPTFLQSCG